MSPTLKLARNRIGQEVSIENRPGHNWVTGLGFDQLRTHIGSSFYGYPNKNVDGEMCCGYVINKHLKGADDKVKSDALKFLLSFSLFEVMCSKQKFLDISIQTAEKKIAATAIVVDYPINGIIGRWWNHMYKKAIELYLTFRFWKQGALPEIITDSKWNEQRKGLLTEVAGATDTLLSTHILKGPNYRHWYVNFVATSPDHQGRGYGSEIMKKVCTIADEENVDCYLECSSTKNKFFYGKFGFVVLGTHILDNAAIEETTMYFMLRRHNA
jgi:ribosomal protein S18 acetylase RimI-like enzyme